MQVIKSLPEGFYNSKRFGRVAMEPSALHFALENPSERRLTPTTTVSSSLFASSSIGQLDFQIPVVEGKLLNGLILEFQVNESGGSQSVTVASPCWWFDRIELLSSSGEVLQRLYPYNMYKNFSMLSQQDLIQWGDLFGINEFFKPTPNLVIPASGTRVFFLPLLGTFIDGSDPGFPLNLANFITVRLYTRSAVVTGSGTLNTSNVYLRMLMRDTTNAQQQKYTNEVRQHSHAFQLIDNRLSQSPSLNLTSAPVSIRDNSTGLAQTVDVVIRASTNTVANNAHLLFIHPGRDATIYMADRSNNKLTGTTELSCRLERAKTAPYVTNAFYRYNPGITPLIFGHSEMTKKSQTIDGALLQDSYNQVWLQCDSRSRAGPILTITPSGTSASGKYFLRFVNPITRNICDSQELAHNANAAAIKAALTGLPNWPNSLLNDITVSGPLTSAATITFNVASSSFDLANEFAELIDANTIVAISINAQTGGAADVSYVTSLSTAGNNGFTSINNVTIELYDEIIRRVVLDTNGNLSAEDVGNFDYSRN